MAAPPSHPRAAATEKADHRTKERASGNSSPRRFGRWPMASMSMVAPIARSPTMFIGWRPINSGYSSWGRRKFSAI